jgi:chromosomal replication initiation ATPase DnaA
MTEPPRFWRAEQLALPIGHRPAFSRADFIVSPANEAAMRLVEAWPDWPHGRVVALFGPPGCGKSHLAAIFAGRSGAGIEPADRLAAPAPGAIAARPAVIEGVDRGVDERRLLYRLNLGLERGATLLLTARQPPARWTVALHDLASRLRQLPAVEIAPPDDGLLGALLIKLFADRQLEVGPEVVTYLVPRIERSYAVLGALVEALDLAALRAGRRVSLPLARTVLTEHLPK